MYDTNTGHSIADDLLGGNASTSGANTVNLPGGGTTSVTGYGYGNDVPGLSDVLNQDFGNSTIYPGDLGSYNYTQ